MGIAAVVLLSVGTTAQAATVIVAGGDPITDSDGCGGGPAPADDPCDTIQAGVNAAAAGDAVDVAPATYVESVLVDKPGLQLLGPWAGVPGEDRAGGDEAIVDGPDGTTAAITVAADNVRVAGFMIAGRTAPLPEPIPGIELKANGAEILDSIVEGSAPGVRLAGSNHLIASNAFYANEAGYFSNGVDTVTEISDVRISDNYFEGFTQIGVHLMARVPKHRITIEGNVSVGLSDLSGAGFVLDWPRDSALRRNVVEGGSAGIGFDGAERFTIASNSFTGQSSVGIAVNWNLNVPANKEVSIVGNDLSGIGDPNRSYPGAVVVDSGALADTLLVSGNRIAGNYIGIDGADAQVLAENNWWGCNGGPDDFLCDLNIGFGAGLVDADPWLVLSAAVAPKQVTFPGKAHLQANIWRNSDGAAAWDVAGLPEIPFSFTKLSGPGTIGPVTPLAGIGTATLSSSEGGTTAVRAQLDEESVDAKVEFKGKPVAARDTNAPRIENARLSPNVFAVARRNASATQHRRQRGTTLRFGLSEAASVRADLRRVTKGRRVRGRCLARRPGRKGPPCTRTRLAGKLARQGRRGENSSAFSGWIRGRRLAIGRYRATLVATDGAGNVSQPRSTAFRIVRP